MSIAVSASSTTKRVVIHEGVPLEAVRGVSELIERYYIIPYSKYVGEYRKSEFQNSLEYSWIFRNFPLDGRETSVSVKLLINQQSIELEFADLNSNDPLQMKVCSRIIDDVQNIVWSYFQHLKLSSLYFVIGEQHDESQSEAPNHGGMGRSGVLKKIFSGNMTNTFLLFMVFSFVLFFLIGVYTIFVMIVFQFIFLIFSDKIALNLGNVRPSREHPLVTIISIRSSPLTLKDLKKYGKKILPDVRSQIVSAVGEAPTTVAERSRVKSTILEILSRYGIHASMNDIEIRTRNVFSMVERVATKFGQKTPNIVIANSVVSNASATGISKNHSTITITAGALEDLNESELESVVGHELGHIKGHDPLILFGVTSFEFFGRFYIWYPLLISLGFLYFIFAFGAIFSIGKVLETRADTESALLLGTPGSMASSLTKIGLRQLYHEKYSPGSKIMAWFQFDPHPPIYFRVARMSEFATSEERSRVRHVSLVSLRDCIVGFLSAF